MKEKWIKYTCLEVDNLPHERGGVYIYTKPSFNGFEEVVYVGQTNDFYRRHNYEHTSEDEKNKKLLDFLNNRYDWNIYICELDKDKLDGVEKYIFVEYSPLFNNDTPPGEELICCDLPPMVF